MPRLAVVDTRIPEKSILKLKSLGFEAVRMPPFSRLSAPVASHPDMLICPIGDKIITHKEYFEENTDIFNMISRSVGRHIVLTDEAISDVYPNDVLFNVLILCKTLYSLRSSTSQLLLDEGAKQGYEIINVKQGYAKCSVCPVSDNAAITSDASLANAMKANGIDVLLVRSSHVKLTPYEYGFIGGASGYDEKSVYFCGSLDTHPDSEIIKEFCEKHSKPAISLSDEALFDVGTIFIL